MVLSPLNLPLVNRWQNCKWISHKSAYALTGALVYIDTALLAGAYGLAKPNKTNNVLALDETSNNVCTNNPTALRISKYFMVVCIDPKSLSILCTKSVIRRISPVFESSMCKHYSNWYVYASQYHHNE